MNFQLSVIKNDVTDIKFQKHKISSDFKAEKKKKCKKTKTVNCSFSMSELDFEIEHITDLERISALESQVIILKNKIVNLINKCEIQIMIIKKLQNIMINFRTKINELKHCIKKKFKNF